jgi:hypothetical protein
MLGVATATGDAAVNLDAGSGSETTVILLEEGGAADSKAASAPVRVPGTSPLCNVPVAGLKGTGCDPDREACIYDATDGGPDANLCEQGATCDPENGGPPVAKATCRVVAGSSAPAPGCSIAYGTGRTESRCTTSADCDIGYECTGGLVDAVPAVMGTCKHYCCDGNSTCAEIGQNLFCDIEPVFHGINLVPVCTFGTECTPFGSDCAEGETCTLVDEATIATACVTPGLAAVGEACSKEKCGPNLACISNTCRQLCKLTAPEGGAGACPATQTCVASSLLGAYANVGLCSD